MNTPFNPQNPVVLFIPEAGIYPYLRGLMVLGDAITKKGGRVLVTRDSGQMLRSPMMAMLRTPSQISLAQEKKIRRMTYKNLEKAHKKYNFSYLDLADLVDDNLVKEINELITEDADLRKITFRNFPVGEIAEFDFILETKFPYSPTISDEHKELYIAYIKNTALALAITDRICEQYNPSLFLTFNEYAQCQAVWHSAKAHDVRRMALTYPVCFNIDASRFSIWESSYLNWIYKHCQNWSSQKDVPVNKDHVRICWQDIIFRMYSSGSHIFSSRKEKDPAIIFNKLNLDPRKKTIVVYTSGQDERRCAELTVKVWGEDIKFLDAFSNHTEWLTMLRDYVATRDDIQIVVRIHPREGARQFGFDSQHLKKLKATFTENTSNFIIIWPNDPISSYDLMELADICLIAWSTMGQEVARLGIPVLSCTGNMLYADDDFIQVATDKDEYKIRLDRMITMDYTWNHLVKATRFFHWRTFIPSLDLGETVPSDFYDDAIWPDAPSSKVQVISDIISGKQDLINYTIEEWHKSLTATTSQEESEAVREGIRRFIDGVFYPPYPYEAKFGIVFRVYRKLRKIIARRFPSLRKLKDSFVDYHLEFSTDASQFAEFQKRTRKDYKLRIIVQDGLYAILIHKGKMLRRMSPVIIRLAKLHTAASLLV